MNCLEFRRLMLADPRHVPAAMRRHADDCAACGTLMKDLTAFEHGVHEAMTVSVPEALAERVLLRRKIGSSMRTRNLALAASVLVALGGAVKFFPDLTQSEAEVVIAAEVGANHPAVAAINYVVDHEPDLLRTNRSGDPQIMRAAFAQLGLRMPANAKVLYLGKCPVPGGTGEHVVMETAAGHFTLILVPRQSVSGRIVVSDRDKTAIAGPAGAGSYIVITDSLPDAMQFERSLL